MYAFCCPHLRCDGGLRSEPPPDLSTITKTTYGCDKHPNQFIQLRGKEFIWLILPGPIPSFPGNQERDLKEFITSTVEGRKNECVLAC